MVGRLQFASFFCLRCIYIRNCGVMAAEGECLLFAAALCAASRAALGELNVGITHCAGPLLASRRSLSSRRVVLLHRTSRHRVQAHVRTHSVFRSAHAKQSADVYLWPEQSVFKLGMLNLKMKSFLNPLLLYPVYIMIIGCDE